MPKGTKFKVYPDIPDSLLRKYMKADFLAVDTEMQGLKLERDQVCLVQLCDEHRNLCLVQPTPPKAPANLKKVLEYSKLLKIFHYALTDVGFLRQSLGIKVKPFHCTRVMSKLVRTYTNTHSLKDVVSELVGVQLEKESQQTNWAKDELSQQQLRYAANDVLFLIPVYQILMNMLQARKKLPSGISGEKLNTMCQAYLPTLVEIVINGYANRDEGWDTELFAH